MKVTHLFPLFLAAASIVVPRLPAADTPVVIPDPNLAEAVRQALNLPPGSVVMQSAMLNLSAVRVDARVCDDDDDGGGGCVIRSVTDLTGLDHASNLQSLYLGGGPDHIITSLEPIRGLTRLDSLRLPHAVKATGDALLDVTETIGDLPSLTSLSLEGDGLEARHLEPIARLSHLELLDLDDNNLADISPLRALESLRELDLDGNPIHDLSPLAGLQQLRDLDLSEWIGGSPIPTALGTPPLRRLDSLPGLRGLRELRTTAEDLGPLARLDRLESLEGSGRIADLTPLANLERLESLELYEPYVQDIAALGMLPVLQPSLGGSWTSWVLDVDFTKPSNAAVWESYARRGMFLVPWSGGIAPAKPPWNPTHFIPDGRMRRSVAGSLGVSEELLHPLDLAAPWFTFFSQGGLRSLRGIEHGSFLKQIWSPRGWLTDLSPLGALSLSGVSIDLRDNHVNDVTPLVGKPFLVLDLRGNPIDPATVPSSWWTDERVGLDPPRPLDTNEWLPDASLRAAVRVPLGLKAGAPVQATDLERLEYLYAEAILIGSVQGLETATHLKGAALRNNVITSLAPLAQLPALRWLRISGNPLGTEAQAVIAALRARGVRVDDDQAGRFLSAITPVNGVVYADGYQLPSTRYLRLFPEVRELFLSDNYLRDIALLEELPRLERVHVDGNLIIFDPGTAARATLETLVARGVEVEINPQRPAAAIGTLIMDQGLQRVIADSLALPFVRPRFTQDELLSVTELDWEKSFPSNQPPLIEPAALLLMPNLARLSLEGTGLSDIGFLAGLSRLTQLDLDYNTIADLSPLRGLTDLVELDVNNNRVSDLAPLASLTKLQSLDLDHNEVADLSPLASLIQLETLDLEANRITNIAPLSTLGNLRWLHLRQNRVSDIGTLTALTSLDACNLAFNNLEMNAAQLDTIARLNSRTPPLSMFATQPQFLPKPQISFTGGDLALEWVAEGDVNYALWFSSDLITWSYWYHPEAVGPFATGKVVRVSFGNPAEWPIMPASEAFYRVGAYHWSDDF